MQRKLAYILYTPSEPPLPPSLLYPLGGGDLGSGIAAAGQDISRAVAAGSDQQTKLNGFTTAINTLTLDKMALENDLLRSQIAKINQPATPPSVPTPDQRYLIPGQGATAVPNGIVVDNPLTRTGAAPENSSIEPGAVVDMGYSRTAGGGYAPVPSKDAKERMEDMLIPELMWSFRNNVLPTIGLNQNPPPVDVPPGYDAWIYNPFLQEYRPHKRSWLGLYY